MQEFFEQAANEKKHGLPVTAMMNPEQTDLPTIQTGFINFVIRPWFDLWGRLLKDRAQGPLYQHNVNENLKLMQIELQKVKNEKGDDDDNGGGGPHDDDAGPGAAAGGHDEAASTAASAVTTSSKGGHKRKNRSFGGSAAVSRTNGGSRVIADSKAMALTDVGSAAMHGKERSISVVDMTFEDINKVQMMDNMHKLEQLKSQQKEYYDAQSAGTVDKEYADRQMSPQFTGSEMNGDIQYLDEQYQNAMELQQRQPRGQKMGLAQSQPLHYEQDDDKDEDEEEVFHHHGQQQHHHIVSSQQQHHHHTQSNNEYLASSAQHPHSHSHRGHGHQMSAHSASPNPPSARRSNSGGPKKKRLLYSNPSNEFVEHSFAQSLEQQQQNGAGGGGPAHYAVGGGGGGPRRNSLNGGTANGAGSKSSNPRNSKKAKKSKKKRNRKQSTNLESISEVV